MATTIAGDNVNVPGQVTIGTAPAAANEVVRLTDMTGAFDDVIVAVDPVAAPTNGVPMRWNSVTNTLWFWDGSGIWVQFG